MEKVVASKDELMGKLPVPMAIMRLAIPAIIGMIVMAVYNMADTYFVSQSPQGLLGTAAVSVFMPILMITQAISILFASGGSAYVSRLLGAKDKEKANKTAAITVASSFLCGVAVAVIGLIFLKPVLLAFGASEATLQLAEQYAVVMLIVSPIQLTNMAFNNVLRSEGNAVPSMAGMVIGALLNIALDPLFIFTFNMGVLGAAIATGISQCVAFVILGMNYWRKKTTINLSFKHFRFDGQILKYIMKIGVSTFVIQALAAVGFALINAFAVGYGDGAVASFGIVNRIQFIGFAIVFGFGQGFQPVAGYNFGAHKYDRLTKTLSFGITCALLIGLGIFAVCNIFSVQLITIFTTESFALSLGSDALKWNTAGFPFTAFSIIVLMMLQALGRAKGALVVSLARQGLCLIPCVIILANTVGLYGLVYAPFVSDILSGIIAIILSVSVFTYIKKTKAEYKQSLQTTANGT